MAASLSDDELALAGALLNQLGDTLATLSIQRQLCSQRTENNSALNPINPNPAKTNTQKGD